MEEKKKAEEEKEILELNKCTFYPKVNLATSTYKTLYFTNIFLKRNSV